MCGLIVSSKYCRSIGSIAAAISSRIPNFLLAKIASSTPFFGLIRPTQSKYSSPLSPKAPLFPQSPQPRGISIALYTVAT